jgi:acetaldehyde dehydrogenase/alcohol dehydrogenase
MVPFSNLAGGDDATLERYVRVMHFPRGTRIVKQGSPGEGCFFIDAGRVRLEIDIEETNSDAILGYLDAGMMLGEFSLLDEEPRSASAYAHTDVAARWLSKESFEAIRREHPQIAASLLLGLSRDLTHKIRAMNERLANTVTSERTPADIEETVAAAVAAQKAFAEWPDDAVDPLLRDVANAIAAQAEPLAEASVQETGYGIAEHKVAKIRFASLEVLRSILDEPGCGVLGTDGGSRITEVAAPMGVVLGLIPVTNPVPTMVFKTLICLKARNALIMSCHCAAEKVGERACRIMQAAICKHGAPEDLIQLVRPPVSRRKTTLFMMHPDVSFILATGGPSMVRAAYSSGTPAIGVGCGNAPVWVCADADIDTAAGLIIDSKSFDNGVICGSENNLVVDGAVRDAFIEALERHGAAILTPDEIGPFTESAFDMERKFLRRETIGQTAASILDRAGIDRKDPVRLVVVPCDAGALDGVYGREKLAPIVSLFTVDGEAEGFALCKRLLANQGSGHTAIIHTKDSALAERFGVEMPASRVLVNCPGSQGCIGLSNGLTPSLTLGCGTFGGSSTTDNVSFHNVYNVKRIAHAL